MKKILVRFKSNIHVYEKKKICQDDLQDTVILTRTLLAVWYHDDAVTEKAAEAKELAEKGVAAAKEKCKVQ